MRSVGSGEHFCTFHELARGRKEERKCSTDNGTEKEGENESQGLAAAGDFSPLSGSTSLRVVYWPHIFDGRILAPRLQVLFETAGCLYKRRRRRRKKEMVRSYLFFP